MSGDVKGNPIVISDNIFNNLGETLQTKSKKVSLFRYLALIILAHKASLLEHSCHPLLARSALSIERESRMPSPPWFFRRADSAPFH